MRAFATYHPVVNFTYFTLVIVFSMFFMHPVCLFVSLVCAFSYSVLLNGKKAAKFHLLYMLPMLAFAALLNPAFNHEGVTILTYLPSGNPLTFESIAYGIAAAAMIASVICWFSCCNAVITSDKVLYLFGRVIPSLSLILSMVLRFVPRFQTQIHAVANAQKCIGKDASSGGLIRRAKNGIHILSAMVTWSLESAIETADSMKSRGYGLPNRTAFSIFTFDKRDKGALLCIAALALYVLFGALFGGMRYRYFPSMKGAGVSFYSITLFAAYGLFCILPVIFEVWEEQKWKATRSNS